MKDRILVVSVGKPYDFKTDDGKDLHGCSMHYLMTGDVTAPADNEGMLGYTPCKESMPTDFYDRAKANGLPAYADVVFGMKNSGGKTVLYIQGLDFAPKAATTK